MNFKRANDIREILATMIETSISQLKTMNEMPNAVSLLASSSSATNCKITASKSIEKMSHLKTRHLLFRVKACS